MSWISVSSTTPIKTFDDEDTLKPFTCTGEFVVTGSATATKNFRQFIKELV
jgi:hypothetical protein